MAALELAESPTIASLLRQRLARDPAWAHCLTQLDGGKMPFRLHLGVFIEPFLSYVLEGRKTIESRFSRRPMAPYQNVSGGDMLLVKQSGGPIVGVARIEEVWSYELDAASWTKIRREFTEALCAQDPKFWAQRSEARYATLMALGAVRRISPLPFAKRDRRGWVVLGGHPQQQLW